MRLERSSEIRIYLVALLILSSISSIVAYASGPATSSKGCAEGWGYYVGDSDPICEPLDKIGEGPPQDMGFCAALGCPYNPPNLPADGDPSLSPDLENKDQNKEKEELKDDNNNSSTVGEQK
jgi:hypothetical protein